jgi:hypothetical protein
MTKFVFVNVHHFAILAGIVSRVMSKVACSLGYGSGWGKVADRVLVIQKPVGFTLG